MQDGFLLRRLDVAHEKPQALAMAQARAATDLSRGSVMHRESDSAAADAQ